MATAKAKAKKILVIVESPSKAKTIGKFLGSRYKVIASVGHVRDLPKSKLGIDVDNDFEPQYISIRGKGDIIKYYNRPFRGNFVESHSLLDRLAAEIHKRLGLHQ